MEKWNKIDPKKAREIAREYRNDERVFFMSGLSEENEEYSIFPIRVDDLSMYFDEYEDGGTITTKDAWHFAMSDQCVNRSVAVTILQQIEDLKEEEVQKGESDIKKLERRIEISYEKNTAAAVLIYVFAAIICAFIGLFVEDWPSYVGGLILLIFTFLIYTDHKRIIGRIKAEWQADTRESCLVIIRHLKDGPRIEGGIGIFMKWWVDTQNKRVVPIVSIVPVPSFIQSLTNLLPGVLGLRYKYFYRRINKDNSLGKKVGSGKKFLSYIEAIDYLRKQQLKS